MYANVLLSTCMLSEALTSPNQHEDPFAWRLVQRVLSLVAAVGYAATRGSSPFARLMLTRAVAADGMTLTKCVPEV